MSLLERLGYLFLTDWSVVTSSETFGLLEFSIEGKGLAIPAVDDLLEVVRMVPRRDKLTLSVAIDSDPITITSEKSEAAPDFISECKSRLQVSDASSSARVTISISKSLIDGTISLYSFETFSRTLRSKTLRERLSIFGLATLPSTSTWVQLLEDTLPFLTKTLHFSGLAPSELAAIRRRDLREKRSDLCHSEYSSMAFIPDDFYLLTRSSDKDVNAVFDELCACASLLFIADISEPDHESGNGVAFKLNGYKVITGTVSPGMVDVQIAQSWFRIYEWAYSGGGVSDKLGLARNIMSLHWKGTACDLAEPGVLTSIRSGYEIYLKQNVKQYIEVKSKLNDYLTDYSVKATKLAEGLTEKFEKNVTAFVTFFITSILAKVLTDKSFTGVFNRSVAIIGVLIVVGSALHLGLTIYVFHKDRKRLADDWDILKRRYGDLLDQADLERIFDKTIGFNQVQTHLTSKCRLFVRVWSILLVAALTFIVTCTDWSPTVAPVATSGTNAASTQRNTTVPP